MRICPLDSASHAYLYLYVHAYISASLFSKGYSYITAVMLADIGDKLIS